MYKFKITKVIILLALLVIPVVLFYLPANHFDSGESLCISKRFLDFECPGCGLTRGVQHFLHFEFAEAWMYNKLTFIVVPIGIYFWFIWIVGIYKDLKKQLSEK